MGLTAADAVERDRGAPVKFAPLIVTLAPIPPWAGEKLVIRGATVKLVALVAVPPGVVTADRPASWHWRARSS